MLLKNLKSINFFPLLAYKLSSVMGLLPEKFLRITSNFSIFVALTNAE